MFEEYKKLLSWSEIKKLNSWHELGGLPYSEQIRFSLLFYLKALCRWQVWLSLLFLAVCGYLCVKGGVALGLKFGIINVLGLLGGAIGGGVFSIVLTYEAKKALYQMMQKDRKKREAD